MTARRECSAARPRTLGHRVRSVRLRQRDRDRRGDQRADERAAQRRQGGAQPRGHAGEPDGVVAGVAQPPAPPDPGRRHRTARAPPTPARVRAGWSSALSRAGSRCRVPPCPRPLLRVGAACAFIRSPVERAGRPDPYPGVRTPHGVRIPPDADRQEPPPCAGHTRTRHPGRRGGGRRHRRPGPGDLRHPRTGALGRGRAGIRAVGDRLEPPADHDPRHPERPARDRPPHPQLRDAAGRRVRRGRLDHRMRRRPTARRWCRHPASPARTPRPTRPPTTSSSPSTPRHAATWTPSCAGELAAIPDGRPKQDGVGVGAAAAKQIVALRADGRLRGRPRALHGGHRARRLPADPAEERRPDVHDLGPVTPFVLDSAQQFRPGDAARGEQPRLRGGAGRGAQPRPRHQHHPHPRPDGRRQVLELRAGLEHLEPGRPAGRHGPPRHPRPRRRAAFSALDLALADTTIAMYDAKYADHVWRPVTAIRSAPVTRPGPRSRRPPPTRPIPARTAR